MDARKANAGECVDILDAHFASRDYADWCETLSRAKGVWSPFQTPLELHDDPQVAANGYLAEVEMINGKSMRLVTSPAQFDGEPAQPTRAPEHGEHTEAVLLDLGVGWEEIEGLKQAGAIG
jgi:crotonobetainyl-CoA:carnitine CoA-transferase CaiB-like acyl-CoA transferase